MKSFIVSGINISPKLFTAIQINFPPLSNFTRYFISKLSLKLSILYSNTIWEVYKELKRCYYMC